MSWLKSIGKWLLVFSALMCAGVGILLFLGYHPITVLSLYIREAQSHPQIAITHLLICLLGIILGKELMRIASLRFPQRKMEEEA